MQQPAVERNYAAHIAVCRRSGVREKGASPVEIGRWVEWDGKRDHALVAMKGQELLRIGTILYYKGVYHLD